MQNLLLFGASAVLLKGFYDKLNESTEFKVKHLEIYQHPSSKPGQWDQAFAVWFNISKQVFEAEIFDHGMDFINNHKFENHEEIQLYISDFQRKGYKKIPNQFAKEYGLQRLIIVE